MGRLAAGRGITSSSSVRRARGRVPIARRDANESTQDRDAAPPYQLVEVRSREAGRRPAEIRDVEADPSHLSAECLLTIPVGSPCLVEEIPDSVPLLAGESALAVHHSDRGRSRPGMRAASIRAVSSAAGAAAAWAVRTPCINERLEVLVLGLGDVSRLGYALEAIDLLAGVQPERGLGLAAMVSRAWRASTASQ